MKWVKDCNNWRLKDNDKVLVSVIWDVFRQEYYAIQGKRGKPQYVFKGMKIEDIKKNIFDIVSKEK